MAETAIQRAKQAAMERGLRRLMGDLPLYSAETLKIRTKEGTIKPLIYNRIQLHLHQRLEDQKRRRGWVRHIIGKGRQGGGSTYIASRYYHRTTLNQGIQTYILTHEQKATATLFEMVERFHQHSPLRPFANVDNANELYFDKLDSGYTVGTAGTKATGRSQANQLLHWSEVAWSPNAAGHQAGIVQTVPLLPGTEIVYESTGNGMTGVFHQAWQDAEAGVGLYEATFAPWFWSGEYVLEPDEGFELDEEDRRYQGLHNLTLPQMAWRRAKIQELKDRKLFMQEYPATATEMFQATGHSSYIDPELVIAARKNSCEGIGPLVIGIDPGGRGLNGRFSVAWRRGRKVLKVESRSGIGTNEQIAWIRDIIDRDKPAKVFMDVGGGGDKLYDIITAWGEPYDKVLTLVNFGDPAQIDTIIERDGTKRAGPLNRRAQMWMHSSEWLEQPGGADLPDLDSLQADAAGPGYSYRTQDGKLVLESKEHMKERGIRSPDEWDAVALTFAAPVKDRPGRDRSARTEAREITTSPSQSWMGT